MPAPSSNTPATPSGPAPSYPAIEALVERASAEELSGFFQHVKDGLSQLKGPRAEQAKKIHAAIGSAEELLRHLLDTRTQLEADQRSSKRR